MTAWAAEAVAVLRADDEGRTFPVHRLRSPYSTVDVMAVDASGTPAGGIKYDAVRALFVHDIAAGLIDGGTRLVEAAASGTADAVAHLARLVGLPLTLVLPSRTSPARIAGLEALGVTCRRTDRPAAMYEEARAYAASTNGHYVDFLGRAAEVVDWRGSRLAAAMCASRPQWIVLGVGSGVTSTTVARHVRGVGGSGSPATTRIAVVDAENSAYFPGWASGIGDYGTGMPSRIPGIGRPRMEPGFHPSLVDAVVPVPDAASVAAMRWCHTETGVRVGPSTGANLWGVWELAHIMRRDGMAGTIVTAFADAGGQYASTFHDPAWVEAREFEVGPYEERIARVFAGGEWAGSGAGG